MPATHNLVRGASKAWVSFDGVGVVAIFDDLEVTSITDNGVGAYIVNLTQAFASTSYAAIMAVTGTASGDIMSVFEAAARTASAFSVGVVGIIGGAPVDEDIISVVFWGDLA